MSAMRSPVKEAITRINAGKNHYEVLGVTSTSSSDEIKKSFRSLSLLVHPDKSGEKTDDVFNLVRLAYETLKEPSSRQSYDLKLRSEAQFKSVVPSWPSWSHFSHVNVNVSRPPPPKSKPAPAKKNANNNNNNAFTGEWPSGLKSNTILGNRGGLKNVTCSHCKREIYMEPEVYARFSVSEELAQCCSCYKEFAQVSCPSCRAEYIVNFIKGWNGSVTCTNDNCKKEFPLNYPPPPNTPLWFSFIQKKKVPSKAEEQLRKENDARLQQEAVERSRREAEMLRAQKQAEAEKKAELKRKVFETEQKFASSTNLNSNSTSTSNTNTSTFPTFTHTTTSAPNTTQQTQNSNIHSTIFGNNNPHTQTNGTNGFPTSTTSTTTTTTTSTTTSTGTSSTSSSSIPRRAASKKKAATKKASSNGLSSFFSSSVSSKTGIATSSQNFAKKKRKGSDSEETAPSDVTDSEDEKPKDKKKRKVDSDRKKKGKVRKGRSSDSEDNSKKKKKKLNPRNSGTKRKSRTHESSEEEEDSSYDSMSDEEGEEYEVEDILNKRVLNGNVQYYVKWANYNEEDCTWEPDFNLTHCPEIVEKFEKRRSSGSVL